MTISQELATLVDTLATAASKVGSTPASQKINQLIVELLPGSEILDLQAKLSAANASLLDLAGLVAAALDPEIANEQVLAYLDEMKVMLDGALP